MKAFCLGCLLVPPLLAAPASLTPPMGWSSWYAFGDSVDQTRMEATYAKLTNRSVLPGRNYSLKDVGYTFANIDDGWQACNAGVDGSFHSASGEPLVNTTKFPDIAHMTAEAISRGLTPGFYMNNYICSEGMPTGGIGGVPYMRNMRGSVDFLSRNRFGYIKIDSGSVYNDMQLWHDLINASGRTMTIENCHQGHLEPNSTWCPFDLFRTSGDLHVVGLDIELLATASVLSLSRPGCWAYADTLDSGTPAATRSQFGAYAIMSSPLILSFDILDDRRLEPIWDILTNEDAIQVNQVWAGSPGKLVRKWSPHLPSDPVFAWAEACNTSSRPQQRWRYDRASGTVTWEEDSAHLKCLTADPGLGALSLQDCDDRGWTGSSSSSWLLDGGRLWQAQPKNHLGVFATGILQISPCNSSKPGQRWKLSTPPGKSAPCTVQNDLGFEAGGCWEITACNTADYAEVGVNYGCKPLPSPGDTGCPANGAWAFNSNGSITSVMDRKCLQVDLRDKKTVNVAACSSKLAQRWEVHGASIRSLDMPGMCVDSAIPAPHPGTTGRCVSLSVTSDAGGAGAWDGVLGPDLHLANFDACKEPTSAVSISASGSFSIDSMCVAARHSMPSPFGPLQLWAKPQDQGSVAVLLLNRAAASSPPLNATVQLDELPGLAGIDTRILVRDIWARRNLSPITGSEFQMQASGGDSQFLLLRRDGLASTKPSHISYKVSETITI